MSANAQEVEVGEQQLSGSNVLVSVFEGIENVGKGITYTGLSVVYTGLAYLCCLSVDKRIDVFYGFKPIFAIAGAGYGGLVALSSALLLWLPSEIVLSVNGASLTDYSEEQKRGFGLILDASCGTQYYLGARVMAGYNFSKNFFMGLGAAYNVGLREYDCTLPLFVTSKISFGSKAVSPYLEFNVGCDVLDRSLYYRTGMGSRYRLSSKQNSLNIGTYFESSSTYSSGGLSLSYSF